MKGKSTFTKAEASEIIALIRKKLLADPVSQKSIRDKIRALGFYASDFGISGGYNEHDFLRVVNVIGGSAKVNAVEKAVKPKTAVQKAATSGKRINSDETYILDLCDSVLKIKGIRQHRFDFLKGDTGVRLPVDIYYPQLNLVIEYREKQHTEEVNFFDKRVTASGITRGEQRKKYDALRRQLLPKNAIKLIELGCDDFEHTTAKRLLRNKAMDLLVIRKKLKSNLFYGR